MTPANTHRGAPCAIHVGPQGVPGRPVSPARCRPAAGLRAHRLVLRPSRLALGLLVPQWLVGLRVWAMGFVAKFVQVLVPLFGLVLVLANLPGSAHAGSVPGELPGYVGRLTTVAGDVRWYDRDSDSWLGTPQQPLRNWPLAAGDRLRTGADGRAELRVGSTTLRLGADTDLSLQRLDGQGLVLWLESGSLAVRLSAVGGAGTEGQPEVLTAEGRWLPQTPGHYRIDRQPSSRTPASQGTAWRGELRFEGRDSTLSIPAGRRAELWRDAGGRSRFAWALVERDDFADWVARDERLDDAPVSARYVPAGVTGWQDLDRHGDWVVHPEFGRVWQPREVAPGWAPFHDGRWVWVSPWGWTWIDAAPWGFAPFHYGSWVVWQDRWCWSPGPRQVRPYYAPVLSSWIAGPPPGPNISINIGSPVGLRSPPPRVVIPVLLPPLMVVAPPQIVVVLPPPRVERPQAPQVVVLPPSPRAERPQAPPQGRAEPGRGSAPWQHDADRQDRQDRQDRGRAGPSVEVAPGLLPAPNRAGPAPVSAMPRQVGAAPTDLQSRPTAPVPMPKSAPAPAPAPAPVATPAPAATPVITPLPVAKATPTPTPTPQPRDAGARHEGREAREMREPRDERRPAAAAHNEAPQRTERGDRNTAVR